MDKVLQFKSEDTAQAGRGSHSFRATDAHTWMGAVFCLYFFLVQRFTNMLALCWWSTYCLAVSARSWATQRHNRPCPRPGQAHPGGVGGGARPLVWPAHPGVTCSMNHHGPGGPFGSWCVLGAPHPGICFQAATIHSPLLWRTRSLPEAPATNPQPSAEQENPWGLAHSRCSVYV